MAGKYSLVMLCNMRSLILKHPYQAAQLWSLCRFSAMSTMTTSLGTNMSNGSIRNPALQICRAVHGKNIKKLPTKPLKFDYSGDMSSLPTVDLTAPKYGFEESDELKNASETVKKILSQEFSINHTLRDKLVEEAVKDIQIHPGDTDSMEVRVAFLTVLLRNQMKHVLQFRKDKVAKSQLVGRIQARKRYLRLLRELDYDRFETVLRKLDIKYVHVPTERLYQQHRRLRLTTQAWKEVQALRWAKLAEFQARLQVEKEEFLKHKEIVLAEIAEDLERLNLEENDPLINVYKKLKGTRQNHSHQ